MSRQRGATTLVVLVASGAVAVVVGGAGLVAPDGFHEASGVVAGDDAGLRSELRAGSAVVLATGLLLLAAVARARLTRPALLAGALVYLSYVAGRTSGLVVDGWPGGGLAVAGVVELALGVACAWCAAQQASPGVGSIA
ncbi:DUF4345 family protein [Cellulomonas timonensis]|uniref:DUF4345 family protein n=1 Tax=Cellulomonas timonensis TaxID=1689271 RepID=UPI00131A6352|nr:DUF4345 family protein [Cellulomonas timonensis]